MPTAEEALAVANELLLMQVQDYVDSKPNLKKSGNVLVKDIGTNSESLSMMRGAMYRVFVYVKKSDIETVSNAVTLTTTTQSKPVPENPKTQETPQPTVTTKPAEPEAVEPNAVQPELPDWKMQAVKSLLACKNAEEVASKLKRMKSEYKIKRFGSSDNCPSIQDVFLVFFADDGTVADVLGPGKSQRIGFKGMQEVSLENYIGKQSIWFTFAK